MGTQREIILRDVERDHCLYMHDHPPSEHTHSHTMLLLLYHIINGPPKLSRLFSDYTALVCLKYLGNISAVEALILYQ